ILKISNIDIDGWTYNLNKKFGQNGIFEFNMAVAKKLRSIVTSIIGDLIFEEMINYLSDLKNPNDDSTIIDASIWMHNFSKRRKEIEKIVTSSNFDSKQLGNDLLTSMIIANTQYEIHSQINVDTSLLRPMTDDEILGVLFELFLPSDTNPTVKMKLLEEIKTVFKDDLTRPVTLEDLDKLKYC
ncbi:45249_t:CDS:2, partial [Gigaspora margarita]